jgi:hypothetical protein
MGKDIIRSNRPVSGHLHPRVYMIIAGLAFWMALSAWGFAGDGAGLVLAVVSIFILIAVAIPYVLWQIWRHGRNPAGEEKDSFRDWAVGELEIW